VPNLVRIVGKLPLPQSRRLAWQASLIDKAYQRDIAEAKRREDRDGVRALEFAHMEELALLSEEQEALFTRHLLKTARRLKVPIPRHHDEEGGIMGQWEQGSRLGMWYLTPSGISELRSSVRSEMRWHIERRAHWVTWFAALTGILGALTGLLAIILNS
jgi:hypothetical protein